MLMARRPLHSVRHKISRPPSGVLAHCYWISAALPGKGLCETKEEGGKILEHRMVSYRRS